jgi:hypothetical protein
LNSQVFQNPATQKRVAPKNGWLYLESNVTKEEIIAAIQNCADELGRVPTVPELKEMRRITLRTIRRFPGLDGAGARSSCAAEGGCGPRPS